MENSPLFNAGKGAVFTEDGTNELEASVMTTNATRRTMSATLLRHVKNPILLVKALLTRRDLCPHAFISDVKAEDLAKELGLELVNQEYFYTDKRWQEHKQTGDMSLPRGTVGAVALDIFGEISVATSTGGLTNKFSGRIGDTPVAGAGYWADLWKTRILRRTRKVGVSGTGDGDWFIRLGTARTVVESVKRGLSLKKASRNAVGELWNEAAAGGVIVLDNRGKWAMDFNCDGMFRGYAKDGEIKVAIFRDDELE
ncbi:Isoaspartyl peptidase [Neolecta irregularis DAH-3]|uniref:beta-aspartyl-peptidase n=1 Tax=Neolecta irregularis (strain DAH-3) TaxID=1198029 RepID=A0A1U7LQR9_NEOID|nr:Isoaspartyl peptidase [Neolecta irregularis DAH-3]|eukprot:OLL25005.1 Isoaspartyl peptidase [Neolecta irregularis DAH-3]